MSRSRRSITVIVSCALAVVLLQIIGPGDDAEEESAEQPTVLEVAADRALVEFGEPYGDITGAIVDTDGNRIEIVAETDLDEDRFERVAARKLGVDVELIRGRWEPVDSADGSSGEFRINVAMSGAFRRGDTNTCFVINLVSGTQPTVLTADRPRPWVCSPDGNTSWLVRETSGFDLGTWAWWGDSDVTFVGTVTGYLVDHGNELVLTGANSRQCSDMCR